MVISKLLEWGSGKELKKEMRKTNGELELYHLPTDIKEQNNVAELHPNIVAQIEAIIQSERTTPEIEKFKLPVLDN